jgi:cell division protein FtsB
MPGPTRLTDRRDQRRQVRAAGKRRRRGGAGRGPVVLQRAAGGIRAGVLTVRRAVTAATSGDKPLVVALLITIGLAVVLVSGPTQNYLDARGRVEVLQMKADILEDENTRMQQRVGDLQDEETIELLAREQQGFIRPGEVPYALVPPEVDRPRVTASRGEPEPSQGAWYERAWLRVQAVFGGSN